MTDRVIEQNDRQSAVWLKMKKHYEARLATLRAQNDGSLTLEQTAKLRGRIAEVKTLLSLESETPGAPAEDALFKD